MRIISYIVILYQLFNQIQAKLFINTKQEFMQVQKSHQINLSESSKKLIKQKEALYDADVEAAKIISMLQDPQKMKQFVGQLFVQVCQKNDKEQKAIVVVPVKMVQKNQNQKIDGGLKQLDQFVNYDQLFKHLLQELNVRLQNSQFAKKIRQYLQYRNKLQKKTRIISQIQQKLNKSEEAVDFQNEKIHKLQQNIDEQQINCQIALIKIEMFYKTVNTFSNLLKKIQVLHTIKEGDQYFSKETELFKNLSHQNKKQFNENAIRHLNFSIQKNEETNKFIREKQQKIKEFFQEVKYGKGKENQQTLFKQVTKKQVQIRTAIQEQKQLQEEKKVENEEKDRLKLKLISQKEKVQMKLFVLNNLRHRIVKHNVNLQKEREPILIQKTKQNGYPGQPIKQLREEVITKKVAKVIRIQKHKNLLNIITAIWLTLIVVGLLIMKIY